MKVRRTITLAVGAALGAGGMYLLDPEHGPARRREAAKQALARAREGVQRDPKVAMAEVRTLADRAREGFAQARLDA